MDFTIDGNKMVLQEPLHGDILNAERQSKESTPMGTIRNETLFSTLLTVSMIASWTAPDKSVVKPEDYRKVITEQATDNFVGKLNAACAKVNELSEQDRAFLMKLKEQVPPANSPTPSKQ